MNDIVVDASAAIGSVFAKTCNRDVHQTRIQRSNFFITEPQALQSSRSEVLDEDIRLGDEFAQHLFAGIVLEVNHEGLLAAVMQCIDSGHPIFLSANVAHHVTHAGGLDFDDFSTLVCKHHARKWARDHGGEVNDLDTGQWACAHRGAPCAVNGHGRSRSRRCASSNKMGSEKCGPMICRPTGNPSTKPAGTEMPGFP